MRSTPDMIWRSPPRWLYWVAAPLAPLAVAVGALLCLVISIVLTDVPDREKPSARS
jgi:hypothetical protein